MTRARAPAGRRTTRLERAVQVSAMRSRFPEFAVTWAGGTLTFTGFLSPTEVSPSYLVEASYAPWHPPTVWIREPTLVPTAPHLPTTARSACTALTFGRGSGVTFWRRRSSHGRPSGLTSTRRGSSTECGTVPRPRISRWGASWPAGQEPERPPLNARFSPARCRAGHLPACPQQDHVLESSRGRNSCTTNFGF
jgi:hypothetical protein